MHIEMDQVPKILKPLVAEWTREGYIVSFKVRTFVPFIISVARSGRDCTLIPSYTYSSRRRTT